MLRVDELLLEAILILIADVEPRAFAAHLALVGGLQQHVVFDVAAGIAQLFGIRRRLTVIAAAAMSFIILGTVPLQSVDHLILVPPVF